MLVFFRERLRTPKGLAFNAHRVTGLRNNHGIPPDPTLSRKADDIYTALEAAKILGVDRGNIVL